MPSETTGKNQLSNERSENSHKNFHSLGVDQYFNFTNNSRYVYKRKNDVK